MMASCDDAEAAILVVVVVVVVQAVRLEWELKSDRECD
jgi:hypothetical protein